MNKEELYNLALNDVHKYNLLNEIFAIEDLRSAQRSYCFKVNGFISLDVLNKYVNSIDENTNLKQALNEIKECLLTKIRENQKLIEMLEGTGSFRIGNAQSKIKDYQECLQIIDKVGGNE